MTAAFTIITGLALLVVGQVIIRSLIDPVYEVRKLRGEIADALICYANIYLAGFPPEYRTPAVDEARDTLRSLGSQLEAKCHAVPWYRFFAF
jgi:hypothetical protein